MNEKQIGEKYAALLTNSLRGVAQSTFARHLFKPVSVTESEVIPRIYLENQEPRLSSFSLRAAKHGFILHHGIASRSVRRGGERTRFLPRKVTYSFATHLYTRGMRGSGWLSKVSESSLIDSLAREVALVRGEAVTIRLAKIDNDK